MFTHGTRVSQVNQGKEIPSCGNDYTCDERTRPPASAKKHLAIYTYNIGSYEVLGQSSLEVLDSLDTRLGPLTALSP